MSNECCEHSVEVADYTSVYVTWEKGKPSEKESKYASNQGPGKKASENRDLCEKETAYSENKCFVKKMFTKKQHYLWKKTDQKHVASWSETPKRFDLAGRAKRRPARRSFMPRCLKIHWFGTGNISQHLWQIGEYLAYSEKSGYNSVFFGAMKWYKAKIIRFCNR